MTANPFGKANRMLLLLPPVLALNFGLSDDVGNERMPADPPTLRATVNLTIGGANDDRDEYSFGVISGLVYDASGRVYVADGKIDRIRVYSDKGEYLYSIGRPGQGPGDLAGVANIGFAKDGSLWAVEYRNRRFSVLQTVEPAGKFLRSVPMQSTSVNSDRVHWDPSGRAVVITSAPQKPGAPFRSVRLYVDDKGTVAATDSAPPVSPDSTESWVIRSNGGISNYSKPFGTRRLQAFGGEGMAAFATNTAYAVQLVDARGRQVALIRRDLKSAPLSAADRATAEDARVRIARNMNVPISTLELDMPTLKPIIERTGFDLDGRLWIERSVEENKPREADVYDKTGKWVAVMQWPREISLAHGAVKGNIGLGVGVDSDGVQRVVRQAWK